MMRIDAHVKIGDTFRGESIKIENYISEMEKNEIDKAILCPNKPRSYMVADGNNYVQSILERGDDRFVGAVRINPWHEEEALAELVKRVDAGFRALYLNPWEEQYPCNSRILFPIMNRVKALGLFVIVEAGYPWVSQIFQIADLANRYPEVKFIATNAGQLDLSGDSMSNVSWVMDNSENIYLGTSGACGAEWLAEMEQNHPGRVVFESNYPFMEPHIEIFRIEKGFMKENEKKRILGENIQNFLE